MLGLEAKEDMVSQVGSGIYQNVSQKHRKTPGMIGFCGWQNMSVASGEISSHVWKGSTQISARDDGLVPVQTCSSDWWRWDYVLSLTTSTSSLLEKGQIIFYWIQLQIERIRILLLKEIFLNRQKSTSSIIILIWYQLQNKSAPCQLVTLQVIGCHKESANSPRLKVCHSVLILRYKELVE